MDTITTHDLLDSYRQAVESKDNDSLCNLYAEDAVYTMFSERNRPSSAESITGRDAIVETWKSASTDLTHEVRDGIAGENGFSFTLICTYPNGGLVVANAVCDVENGRIVRQSGVEAWDL